MPEPSRNVYLQASRRCHLGFVLHASSPGYVAENIEGALSVKTMRGGDAHYTLQHTRLLVNDGAYTILNARQPYTVEVAAEVESFCLFFDSDTLLGAWQAITSSDSQLLELPDAQTKLEFFEKRYSHDDVLSPLLERLRRGNLQTAWSAEIWDDHLLKVLEGLFRVHRNVEREIEQLPSVRASTRTELYRRLHRARDYLEASLNEPLNLSQVANVAHLSPYHFHRAFKSLFGETPAQHLTRRRLERAQALLRLSQETVLEICAQVGFESLGSFTSLFRRQLGVTPAAYRRTSRQR
jgi:AraC family transcriptional regulator